ncbi:MAG: hypothetical protein ACLRVR_08475 [Flavonifractor plautii]
MWESGSGTRGFGRPWRPGWESWRRRCAPGGTRRSWPGRGWSCRRRHRRTGWAGAGAVPCGTVLLPGTAGPLARALNARQAVSYGTSPRDTLTFSSLEGDRLCLAVQRELVTLGGAVVEQQELVLPFSTGASPLPFLAAAGTLLLLGVPPEELPARLRLPA